MERKPVGVGIVGYGGYGRFLIECWREMPEVRVVALAGRHRERAEAAARELGVPKVYQGHEALLVDPEIQIVAIATPPASHKTAAIAAARAGKHVFCEKPLATTLEDGEQIRQSVRAAGVRFCMGFVLRYNELFRRLKALVDERVLGELHRVDFANFAGDEGLDPQHWFWDLAQSGGILVEHGVHFFDIYSWLIGSPPARVTGHRTVRAGTAQEDRVVATVEHRSGALATYYHAFDKPSRLERTSCLLGFDQGYVRVEGWIALSAWVDASVSEEQWRRLTELLPPTGGAESPVVSTPVAPEQAEAHGGGHDCRFERRAHYEHVLSDDKQAVYADSVRAALRDLLRSIDDPTHEPAASLDAGVESLRIATAV